MLTITSADHSLAAELGLFLVQLPVTDEDRNEAKHPGAVRVPQTWLVRSILTKKRLGNLRFTAVDSLHASKYAAGTSALEETISDALRWITPLVRHVRTGTYEGTEVIVRRYGSMIERPRALTMCRARSTGADYTISEARSALINGRSHEMCPTCREGLGALEGHEVREFPLKESARSTAAQQTYLRHLLDEGARSGHPHLPEPRGINRLSRSEASALIDRLRFLKEHGWSRSL